MHIDHCTTCEGITKKLGHLMENLWFAQIFEPKCHFHVVADRIALVAGLHQLLVLLR